MSYQRKKIVIIGGGAAGVSAAAYALQKGFLDVTLIESSGTLGGLHKDVEIDGLHFDLGAFFFWQHHNILRLFPGLAQILVYAESSKHFTLTNQHNLDHYPLTLKSYIQENGYLDTAADFFRVFYRRISKPISTCKNVSDVMTYYMGPFFKKTGLHFYIERLYGLDPKLLDTEFAYHRLESVISKFTIKNMLHALLMGNLNYFKKYEILRETWARPESGFESMYQFIQAKLQELKCEIILRENVERINLCEKTIETGSGLTISYDYLFSSQPLMTTASMSGISLDLNLKYRPLCSLFYEVPFEIMKDCFVLFNFTHRGRWKRATFHSNYYNRNKSGDSKLRHYFVVESLPKVNQCESETVRLLDQDFKNTFAATKWEDTFQHAKLVGHHVTRNAYPVFDMGFDRSRITDFKQCMQDAGVYMVGRQGQFVHNSSSDASRSSILAIDDIIEKTKSESDLSTMWHSAL